MRIDFAQCLVLDKRLPLFLEVQEQCWNKLGWVVAPFICGDGMTLSAEQYDLFDVNKMPTFDNSTQYGAWWERPNAYNASRGHRAMLERALAAGAENILMLEDDIVVEDDALDILSSTEQFFASNEWDAISLGFYKNGQEKIIHGQEHIVRLDGAAGWHAIILKDYIAAELLTSPEIGPMDWICGEFLHKRRLFFGVTPGIINQRDGFSYVEGRVLAKPFRSSLGDTP